MASRSVYARLVGDIAISWNILERRLESLAFNYLTVDAAVAGFVFGEMGNVTKAEFAKFLIERFEEQSVFRECGFHGVALYNRLRENRNILEHSTPNLDREKSYIGTIGKPDRRGSSKPFDAPISELKSLLATMDEAARYMFTLSAALGIYADKEQEQEEIRRGEVTWAKALVDTFSIHKKPALPAKISPSISI